MNNIIKINAADIGGSGVQTVNARELHTFLESKIRFSDWIKKRVADYGFQEGIDFCRIELSAGMKMSDQGGDLGGLDGAQKNVALESMGYESYGQQGRIEYAVTLDMAKELAMVERNEKGKQARQYFIECERQARNPFQVPQSLPEALRLAAAQAEQIELQSRVIAEQAPKVEIVDRINDAVTTLCIRDAAKTLQVQPSKLTQWLLVNKWMYHRPGKKGYLAYQDRIQGCYLVHKSTPYRDSTDGEEKISEQVRITGRGLTLIAQRLNEDGIGIFQMPTSKRGQPPQEMH